MTQSDRKREGPTKIGDYAPAGAESTAGSTRIRIGPVQSPISTFIRRYQSWSGARTR